MPTLLIASGAYCEPALAAEFGALPPAMLPLGGRRLFESQLRSCRPYYGRILLSLPRSFELDAADKNTLARDEVEPIYVDDGLSLGNSIALALISAQVDGQVDVLYGDTLVSGLPYGDTDFLATGLAEYAYDWYYPKNARSSNEALCGFLSFSNAKLLCERIQASGGHFLNALDGYAESRPLNLQLCPGWLDLGHIHTYFHSRALRTTERAFNSLEVADGVVTKRSEHKSKLEAESNWFLSLPASLKVFTPQHLGEIRSASDKFEGYRIEYLPLPSLSDLLVFGRLPERTWSEVFRQCDRFLLHAREAVTPGIDLADSRRQLFFDKSLDRVQQYERAHCLDPNQEWSINGWRVPSLRVMVERCYAEIERHDGVPAIIHGDLCFSNILYESRLKSIKLIDPRGVDHTGRVSQVGDQRYELAKLAHSIMGSYDFIVAGRFELSRHGTIDNRFDFKIFDGTAEPLRQLFTQTRFCGRRPAEWGVLPAMVLLFLSMLPLHHDSAPRQTALLANALRLFAEFDE